MNLKKKIQDYISSSSFTECFICFYKKVSINYCEKCSFGICDDCFIEIIITTSMYRCPKCRYIPPHQLVRDGFLPRPFLKKSGGGCWVITDIKPPENYLSSLYGRVNDYFYVTDEWRKEMRDKYEDSDESTTSNDDSSISSDNYRCYC